MRVRAGMGFMLLTLGACAAPPGAPASRGGIEAGSDALGKVRSIGLRSVERDGIVGCSIAVALDGEVIFAEGFGHADLGLTVPARPETVYDVASVGKQFTAVAALRLVEQDRLSLDQRIRTIVPGTPDIFPDATVEQLLRHTSGFVGGELDEFDPPEQMTRPRYGTDLFDDPELAGGTAFFEPGETFVYCNPGYLVLGVVIEAAAGQRYDRLIRQELLDPVGLSGMTVCKRARGPNMAQAIHRSETGLAVMPHIDMTGYAGQGSICSTVVDLLRWADALNRGEIIGAVSLRSFRSPSSVRGDRGETTVPYGMGQRLGSLGGVTRVGHTGTFSGGSAALVSYPEAGLDIAVLSNTYGAVPHASDIETEIAKLLLGVHDPDVRSLAVPLPQGAADRVEGDYTNGTQTFTSRLNGTDLVVLSDGGEIERLVHVGGLRFRNPEDPDVFQWFAMDGERAGWWIYSRSGHSVDVARRARGD